MKTRLNLFTSSALMLLVLCAPLRAQDASGRFRIGVLGGYSGHKHAGTISDADETYPCCTFTDATGTGYIAGVRAQYDASEVFVLKADVLYRSQLSDFNPVREVFPVLDEQNRITESLVDNQMELTSTFIDLGFSVGYRIPDVRITAAAGPAFIFSASQQYRHYLNIVHQERTFVDGGGTSRDFYKRDLGLTQPLSLGFRFSIGWEYSITPAVTFQPEVAGTLPLTKFGKTGDWKMSEFQARLGVMVEI